MLIDTRGLMRTCRWTYVDRDFTRPIPTHHFPSFLRRPSWMMLQSTIQSICTIVLPKPSFKVPPSQPDPIYYTGISANRYSYNSKASYSDFNVSTSSVTGLKSSSERDTCQGPRTPRQARRPSQSPNPRRSLSKTSPSPSHNQCRLSRRPSRNSTCCCSCSCPYDISNRSRAPEYQASEFGLLAEVASSLLESPSPRAPPQSTPKARRRSIHSTKPGNPRPASFPLIETPSPVAPSRGRGNTHTRSRSYDYSKAAASPNVNVSSHTKSMRAPQLDLSFPQLDNTFDTFKSLRRTNKRTTSSGSPSDRVSAPDGLNHQSFDEKSKTRPFDFLETLKRSSSSNNFDSSGSSCSSFDASDAEGAYPSTARCSLSSPAKIPSHASNRSSHYSDALFPTFALSPIIEDSGMFDDVDAILACYGDSPVLGRTNAPGGDSHDSFDIDDADWQPEVVFEPGLNLSAAAVGQTSRSKQTHSATMEEDIHRNTQKLGKKRTSFVLKSTSYGDSSMPTGNKAEEGAYKDLLSPPALMLTFPTPEMEDIAAFSDPASLEIGPSRLSTMYTTPQTPLTASRVPLGDSTNLGISKPEPPTPTPPFPRCTSCGFGFGFEVTGSMDVLPTFNKASFGVASSVPCRNCRAQWQKCCKWYGKRGWAVGNSGDGPHEIDVEEGTPSQPQEDQMKKRRILKRSSKRLSQVIENIFNSDSKPGSAGKDSKRNSKRASFWSSSWKWTGDTSDNQIQALGAVVGGTTDVGQHVEGGRFGRRTIREDGEFPTSRVQSCREVDEKENIRPRRMLKEDNLTWKTITSLFSRSEKEKALEATSKRRSFLDFGGGAAKNPEGSRKRRSYGGVATRYSWR